MPVRVPREPSPNTTIYSMFRGVQLTDPTLCSADHSPYSLNLISNNEGLPETRPGWRKLHTLSGKVYSLEGGVVNAAKVFIAHVGTKLYKITDSTATEIYSGAADSQSKIFFATHSNMSKAFILTGTQYLVYDGSTVQSVEAIATVPVVIIARKPSGGGTPYQSVNLLQPKRTDYFQGNGTDKVYQLSTTGLDNSTVTVQEVTASGTTTRTDVTVDASTGKVTFTTAPTAPPVAGTDNIYITYTKTVSGYADRIKKCTIINEYGESGSGRIFASGNNAFPNYDWYSELNDPTYFADSNYSIVGNVNTAIMGYSKLGKYQLIVKEDNNQDSTIFIRYPSTLANGNTYFKLEVGIAGSGAIATRSFVTLIDEPLFLSRTGLYAITSNNVTAERTLQNRSFYVDEQLTKEKNISKAISIQWNGYYLLCIDSKVYAFDSKSKDAHGQSFVYNCFLWDNIPATCFANIEGALYFGDSSGNICKFNTDIEGVLKYNDNNAAINVVWSTKMDNDGLPNMRKTMMKKGSGITTKPFSRSTYSIFIINGKVDSEKLIRSFNRDIFNLDDVSLERFSVEPSPYAKFTPFKKKIKKYECLQIIVKGTAMNEGFGIYNIVKQWLAANYVKR